MNVNGFTRLAVAACCALAAFSPRPADAGFDPAIGNYLNPDSVGWGLDVQRIGDFIFVLWFTYRPDGSPIWYLSAAELDGMNWTASIDEFHWNAAKTATPTTVGNMTLMWSDTENATFSWTLNGVSGELPVAFLAFDTGLTTVNHTGHYVAREELGWGASLLSQGDTSAMFLYFYDANGNPVWLLGVDGTPAMQQDFLLNYFEGPGLCPSCIAKKKPGAEVGKVFTQVVVEVRFISIQENFLEEIGVDFMDSQTIGGLTQLPSSVNPNTPLGVAPLGAIDVPQDDGFNDGPYQTINALTPSPNMFTLAEMDFFRGPTKLHMDPQVLVNPTVCNDNLILDIHIAKPGQTGYPQPTFEGKPLNFSLGGEVQPAHYGVSKVGDKSASINLQATFSDGTIAGINIIVSIPDPGSIIIGGLLSNQVTQTNTVPFLSEIPVLGSLFKRKAYKASNSELQILVCAHIVEETAG